MASITSWLLNSFFILLSTVTFFTPFWLLHRLTRPKTEKYTRHSLGEHIEIFFSSKQMNWLVCAWAAAEAIIWFIIPEFLLLLIIFMRIRQRVSLLFWDLLGTILGTIIAYSISVPSITVAHMPYITTGMILQVNYWYQHFGVWALVFQPLSGVPYKVFTNLAFEHNINLAALIFTGSIMRMSRYIFIYIILSGLYPIFHRFAFRRYLAVFVVSCMIFSYFLLKIVNNYGPGYEIQESKTMILDELNKFK